MILRAAAYVSPEQAKGKPVDRLADTWTFGSVLYEMRGTHVSRRQRLGHAGGRDEIRTAIEEVV